MAKITPIDVIKGISGKYGSGSSDYFATNSSSNRIHLAKLQNPYRGPMTDKQLAQQQKFAARQAAATAWLNANKPGEENGPKGTEAYQYVQKLKRQYFMSNIIQVLYKYMDQENIIRLPEAAGDVNTPEPPEDNTGSGNEDTGGGSSDTGGGTGEDTDTGSGGEGGGDEDLFG